MTNANPVSSHLVPVRPVRPAAGYLGGKRNLARRLCAIIEAVPHDGYAEPFVGMGGVFLRRRWRPQFEAINDLSGDVATFFRVLQELYAYFLDMLRWRVASRAEFERLRGLEPGRLTDLQRAARFFYLQRLAFGGKVARRDFGVDSRGPARFDLSRIEPLLAEIHERLAGVVIEQLPFEQFIARYDRPGMLFYCDPPYWGCEADYGAGLFAQDDFARLAAALTRAQGRVLLSINDRPETRALFAGFCLTPVATTYTVGGGQSVKGSAGELLVSNFALELPA